MYAFNVEPYSAPITCQRVESREQRAESREQREESREQREESREQRSESREQRAESRGEEVNLAYLTHNLKNDIEFDVLSNNCNCPSH